MVDFIVIRPATLQEIGQGQPCEGDISQTMTCNEQLCPVDCVMTSWSEALLWKSRTRWSSHIWSYPVKLVKLLLLFFLAVDMTLKLPRSKDWSPCEPYCNGTQTKTREIKTPAAFDGEECGPTKEERRESERWLPSGGVMFFWIPWNFVSRSKRAPLGLFFHISAFPALVPKKDPQP